MKRSTKFRTAIYIARIGLILIAIGIVGSLGLLNSENIVPGIVFLAAFLAVVIPVFRYLLKPRFQVSLHPEDPGAYNSATVPDGFGSEGPGFRTRGDWPGTYPTGTTDSRRLLSVWEHPEGTLLLGNRRFRTLQFKFATLHVEAIWDSLTGCKATAEVRLLHGIGGSLQLGKWTPIGELNWDSPKIRDDIIRPRIGRAAGGESEILNTIYENPSFGIDNYLRNPEVSLHRLEMDEIGNRIWIGGELPLFYMREGYPQVFLCGPTLTLAGRSPDDAPVSFEMKLTVFAHKARTSLTHYRASAKWGNFRLTPLETE